MLLDYICAKSALGFKCWNEDLEKLYTSLVGRGLHEQVARARHFAGDVPGSAFIAGVVLFATTSDHQRVHAVGVALGNAPSRAADLDPLLVPCDDGRRRSDGLHLERRPFADLNLTIGHSLEEPRWLHLLYIGGGLLYDRPTITVVLPSCRQLPFAPARTG